MHQTCSEVLKLQRNVSINYYNKYMHCDTKNMNVIFTACQPYMVNHLLPELSGNVTSGENIVVECDEDYVLDGVNVLTCYDGRWLPEVPRCKLTGTVSCYLPSHRTATAAVLLYIV